MNKKLVITQIIIWSVIGLFLLGVLVVGLFGNFAGARFRPFIFGELKVVHEETVSPEGIGELKLDLRSMDLLVSVTDEQDIRIVQLSTSELDPQEYFTLENANGRILVKQPDICRFWGLNIFQIAANQQIQLFIPKSYVQNLTLKTSSGNVTMLTALAAADIRLDLTSGNLTGDYPINGKAVDINVTSGNIYLDAVVCDGYSVGSTSGDVDIASIEGAGKVWSTSGNVRLDMLSGGNFKVNATSGNIGIGSCNGSGSIHTGSGSIAVDFAQITGDTSIGATSGDIKVYLPQNASVSLYAACTSGDINSNLALSYAKGGKSATASVGSGPYAELTVQTTSGNVSVTQKNQ